MRQEKQLIFDEISEDFQGSTAVLAVNHTKLRVEEDQKLRTSLRKSGASLQQVKKRIFLKVADSNGVSLKLENLPGSLSLVLCKEDPLEAIKALYQFKENADASVNVLWGYVEKEDLHPEQIDRLSKLPTKDVMRAQFLATLDAPASSIVGIFDSLLKSVLYCMEQRSKQ